MTPSEQNDRRWFAEHPDRSYRLRRAIGEEIKDGPSHAVHISADTLTRKAVKVLAVFDTEVNAREAFHG